MLGYMVLIQSERTPDHLESRVNAFLFKFGLDLEKMTKEEFEGHRRSLINKRLEKLKNLESETGRLWSHIGTEYFDFYQIDNDVALIRQLTKADMQSFYNKHISPESPTRAKLSLHMTAQASPPETPDLSTEEKKERLVGALLQYLTSTGLELDEDKVKQDFSRVDVSNGDDQTILSTIRHSIADKASAQKLDVILEEIGKNLETLLVDLKIKAPAGEKEVNCTDVAKKISTPVIINDVDTWKASMKLSEGPRPVNDLSQFEELEPKL
jgi:insulysin